MTKHWLWSSRGLLFDGSFIFGQWRLNVILMMQSGFHIFMGCMVFGFGFFSPLFCSSFSLSYFPSSSLTCHRLDFTVLEGLTQTAWRI